VPGSSIRESQVGTPLKCVELDIFGWVVEACRQEATLDWTAIGLAGFGVLIMADLMVFRIVFPPHTVEGTLLRIVNGLSWVLAVFLILFAFAWMFL
jgi:hypothetical protein